MNVADNATPAPCVTRVARSDAPAAFAARVPPWLNGREEWSSASGKR